MLRFSCFNSHIHGQRTKKQAQPSFEAMVSDCDSRTDVKCSPIHFLDEHGSKIGEMNLEINCRISPMRQFRRSLSLGCNLQEEGRIFEENNSDEHTDVGFSCDGSRDQLHIVPTKLDRKSLAATTTDQDQENVSVEPLNFSCAGVNNESIFSIGDQQYTEKEGLDKYSIQVDAEDVIDSGIHTPRSPSMISKSYSLPNLPSMLVRTGGCSPCSFSAYRNRSSDDLKVLGMMRNETCVHDTSAQHFPGHNEVFYLFKSGKNDGRNGVPDGYDDSYSYAASNKDWIVPEIEGEMYGVQNFQGESSSHQLDHLPNEDFKIRRIADWVIDLQECGPVEEIEVSRGPNDQGNKIPAAKEEANLKPSMHAAKKYISSLSASTNAAQLTNHGLVVIPFLSAFVSLKVVNLSGNSIVKITAGALPRGLHMLNLSKNKISTIEGLRELTRLRILDLSYNRVTRIGHGLASCSSLKELYLAGNKISEVEGLHRLLKLAVLDLRFNKISTSKGVGQLAANYNSLQAISLEGNPAQKNVGDEQLKKHLQGLLPHLAYYNRQSLKSSSFKDSSERSVRLGMAAHQFDRGHKPPPSTSTIRRASHSSTALKQHSSSLHNNNKGQLADAHSHSQSQSQRRLRTKQGSRSTHHRHHHHHLPHPPLDLNMKPLVLPDLSIKKSHSMGALTAV